MRCSCGDRERRGRGGDPLNYPNSAVGLIFPTKLKKKPLTKEKGYAIIRIHTVEAHFAKSSPTEQVTRTVVGEKGADAEGGSRRAFVLVLRNNIRRIVAFAESYQCFLPPFLGDNR